MDVDINHNVNVTTELKKAAENNTLKNFNVVITTMSISGPLVVGKENLVLSDSGEKNQKAKVLYSSKATNLVFSFFFRYNFFSLFFKGFISLRIQPSLLALPLWGRFEGEIRARNVPSGEKRGQPAALISQPKDLSLIGHNFASLQTVI